MAKGNELTLPDDITRHVKPSLLGRNDNGDVIVDDRGAPKVVAPQAFALKEDEEGLSVTWLQCFGDGRAIQVPAAAEAFRESLASKVVKPKAAFVIANVADVLAAGRAENIKLRIVTDPVDGNIGHSEIRRMPREVGMLQLKMANEVFSERYLYSDIRDGKFG